MNKTKPIQQVLLVIMRITLTQLLFITGMVTLASAGNLNGQGILDRRVTLEANNQEIKKVLAMIEKQASIEFTYNHRLLESMDPVTLTAEDASIGEVLRLIFKGGMDFVVYDNEIVLKPARSMTPLSVKVRPPQELLVSGLVTDEKAEGLPGVSIIEKGTTNGTTTDINGRYSLRVSGQNSVLIFSFIGFQTQEVAMNGGIVYDVSMVPDIRVLNEILVVGYGERQKENYTGSVSTVKTKEIVQAPVANISNALTGRLSGLISVQRGGEPGRDASNLLIRGVSTSGNNSPLVVIDGIPRGDFSQLDPNEIESLTLLKDPASAAVFGVRAANGVILITTKRGKQGKSELSFSVRTDWQRPTRLPKYLDSYGYASLFNAALRADGKAERFTPEELEAYRTGSDPDAYPNTDWVDETIGGWAPQQQYNISLSGGTEKIRYFLTGGHVNQKGLYANSAFQRYNFRSNIDADVTKTTRFSLDIGGRTELRESPSEAANQILYFALYAPPIWPAYFSNGLPGAFPTNRNQIERAKSGGYDNSTVNTLLTNAVITQQLPFIEGLSLKGVAAYDRVYETRKRWLTPYTVYTFDRATRNYVPQVGAGVNNITLNQGFLENSSLTLEAHLNYARTFRKHEVGALVLYSQNKYRANELFAGRVNFISPLLDELLAGPAAGATNNGNAFESGRKSLVGRLTYSFDGKYFLEGNFRYDGSTIFSPDARFGFFPSVSAGWKISEEGFMQNIDMIDYFKFRGAYGVLGNDRIDAFRYLSTFRFGTGYPFGTGSGTLLGGIEPSALADPTSTWEEAESLNLGFDGSVFNGKLGFEFDWFYKRTSNILATPFLTIPQTLGIGLPTRNVRTVDNRGVEVALTHENTFGGSDQFKYFLRGNFTYASNELVFTGERPDINPNQAITGRRLNQFFGYRAIGLFQSQEEIDNAPKQPNPVKPGDIRYADVNGRDANGGFTGQPDGKVDGDDVVPIGRSNIPEIIYGISGGLQYRGFDFSFLFQGAGRVNTFITGELAWSFYNGAKALEEHTDYWTPENPDAKYPRLTENPAGNNIERSSYWLKDASYLRLKNVEIGYTLPKGLLSKVSISSARLFVSGQNLLTFDKLKLIDPEGPGDSGTNFGGNSARGWFYPQQKVYAVGVNITF